MNDDDGAPRPPTRGQGVRPRAQTRLELKLQAARTTLYKELGLGDVDQPLIPGILKTQLECRLQRVPRGLRDTRPTITSRLLLLRPSPPGPAPAPPSHQAPLQPAPDAARAWGSPPREAMLPSSPMAPVTAHGSASQPVGRAQATRPLSPLAADPPPTGPPRGHPVAPAHPPAARRGSGRRPTGLGGEQQVVATALGAQGGRRAPFMRQPLTLLPGPTRQWQADKALYYTPISQRASQPPAAFPASLRQGMLMYFSPMEQELALQGWDKVDQQLRHLREAEVAAWNTQQLQERSGRPCRQTGAAGEGGGGGSPEHYPWSGPDVEEEGEEGVQQMGVDQVLTHKVTALAHQLCLHPAVLWHLLEAEQSEEGVGEEGEEEQQQGAEAGQQAGGEAGGETHKADDGQQQRTGSAAAQSPHTSLVLSQQPQPQSLPSNSNDQQGSNSNSKARDALKARGSREAALGKDLPPLHHARCSVTQGVRHVAGVTLSPGHPAGSAPMAVLGAQDATQLLALLQKNYALHHQQASGQASLPPGVDGSALVQQATQAVRLMKLEGEGEGLGGGGGQWGAEDDVLGSLRALWRERQLKRRSRGQGANAMAAATGNSLPSPAPPLGSPPCTRIITWAQPSPPHPPPPPPHGPDRPQDPPTRSPLRPRLASHPPNTASQVSPLAVGTSSRSSTSSTSEVKGHDRLQEAAGEGQRPGSAPSPSMQPLGPDPSPDSGPGTHSPALKPLQSLSCSSLEAAAARPPALPQAGHQQQQQPAEQQGQQQRGQQQGWAGQSGCHQPAEGQQQQQQVLGRRRSLSPTGLVMSRRYQDAADREQWQPLAPGASRPSLLQPWGYQACLLDNSLAMQIAAQQPLPVQSEAQAGTQLGQMGGQGRSLEGTLAAAARPEAGAPHGSGHEAGASVPGPLPGSHFVASVTPAPPTDYPALRRSIARHAGARPAGVTAADKNAAPGTRDSAPSDHDSVPGAGRHAASCDPLPSGNVGGEAAEAVINPPHPLPPRNPKKGTGAPQQAAGSEGACAGGGAGTEADEGGRGQVASQEEEASLKPPAQGDSSAPQGSHSPTPRPGADLAQVAVWQAGRGRARQQPGGRQVLGSTPLHPHPQPASPSGCQPPSSAAVQLPAATLTPPGPPDAQQQGVPQATQADTPLALPPAAAAAAAAAGGIRDGMHGIGQRGDLTAAMSPLLPPPSLATQAPPCHLPTPLAIPPSSVLADNLSPLLAGELSKLRSACAPEFLGQRAAAPAGRAARADAAGRYQPATPLLTLVSDIAESRKMVTELSDARQVMLLLRGAEQQLRPRQLKALRQRQQQQQ